MVQAPLSSRRLPPTEAMPLLLSSVLFKTPLDFPNSRWLGNSDTLSASETNELCGQTCAARGGGGGQARSAIASFFSNTIMEVMEKKKWNA